MNTLPLSWRRALARLGAVGAALATVAGHAQTIIGAGLQNSQPLSLRQATMGEVRGYSLSNIKSALPTGAPVIKRGPISVRPRLMYRALYGTGIEAGPGNPRDTTIQTLSPGALFEIGKRWTLDYSPNWTFYSNEAFRDTFDQSVSLDGRTGYGDLALGFSQSYESSYAMLVETGRQTHQEKVSTGIEGTYRLGQHTVIELTANRSERLANAVTDAPEWTTSDWLQWSSTNWLHYEVSQHLTAAAGVSFGYADVSVGSDMTFTRPQAQVTWRPTKKISLTAQGGVETREFHDSDRGDLESPIYSASVNYQPLATTRLSLSASRGVSASYFANEITRSAGWSAGVEQRFIQKVYVSATFSRQNTGYVATRQDIQSGRDDRYQALNLRASTAFLRGGAFAILFQTGRNSSDDVAYEFSSNQYGCELSYRF